MLQFKYELPKYYYNGTRKRGGQATIRDMRMTVYDILKMLASDMTHDDIIADYPELTKGDIRAALWYASKREQIFRHFA